MAFSGGVTEGRDGVEEGLGEGGRQGASALSSVTAPVKSVTATYGGDVAWRGESTGGGREGVSGRREGVSGRREEGLERERVDEHGVKVGVGCLEGVLGAPVGGVKWVLGSKHSPVMLASVGSGAGARGGKGSRGGREEESWTM